MSASGAGACASGVRALARPSQSVPHWAQAYSYRLYARNLCLGPKRPNNSPGDSNPYASSISMETALVNADELYTVEFAKRFDFVVFLKGCATLQP